MKRIAIALFSLLATTCSTAQPPATTPACGILSIAELRAMARDEAYIIAEDISIEGWVVANDLYGEYYKAIVIGDDSGCIEIEIESHTLRSLFPISACVNVRCTGLALGRYGGSIALGAGAEGSSELNHIAQRDIARYCTIDRERARAIAPTLTTIEAIDSRSVGEYLRINDISFGEAAGQPWCERDAQSGEHITTLRTMYDRQGNSLSVKTIGSCRYAEEKIPANRGDVCGIVAQSESGYSLRIVNHQIIF